jgi:fatty-acyl-CoA synthase
MKKPAPHITALLEQLAHDHANAPALTHDGDRWTYAELLLAGQQMARGLHEAGFRKGDRLAFWLPNKPAYLIGFLACARLGVTCVSINTRYGTYEIKDLITRSGATGLMVASAYAGMDTRNILAEIGHELPSITTMIDVDDGPPLLAHATHHTVSELFGDPFVDTQADGTTPLVIFTTSGTTKAPKLVLHAQYSVAQHAMDIAADMNIRSSLQALPLCGVFGMAQAMGTLASGGHLVMMDSFDAPIAAQLLNDHQIETLFGSDDLFDRMLAQSDAAIPYPHLKIVGFAAFNAALADLPQRAEHRGLKLIGLYGMSECMALYARQDILAPLKERARAGGHTISPKAHFKIVDPDTGGDIPNGTSGELVVKGPSLMQEYAGDAEATAEAFTQDGFFRTGDLGIIANDGTFEFLGRMGDVLRLGGFLVNPLEIESHLQSLPQIEAAQVVAITTPQGPRPVAFIICPGTVPGDALLLEHCAALAKFKRPIRFISLSAFPVTQSANGTKIQRAKLRQMAMDELDRA